MKPNDSFYPTKIRTKEPTLVRPATTIFYFFFCSSVLLYPTIHFVNSINSIYDIVYSTVEPVKVTYFR